MSNPEKPFTGKNLIEVLNAAQERVDFGEDPAPAYEEEGIIFKDETIGTQEG